MIRILLSWAILYAATAGVGFIVGRALTRISECIDVRHLNAFHLFWIGAAATIAACHLVHLWFPLNSWCLLLWLLIGLAGFSFRLRHTLRAIRYLTPSRPFIPFFRCSTFAAMLIFLAYHGASGVATTKWSGAYDTDLYHFNVIRWMNEHPTVPGLGNLHSRLALTSGFLTYSSLADNLWWDGKAAWITYGLFVTVVCGQWLWVIIIHSDGVSLRGKLFCIATLAYVLHLQSNIHPTLYFDEIALLIQMVLALELIVGFRRHVEEEVPSKSYTFTRITLLGIVAALGFSVKPIGALSMVAIFLIAGYTAFARPFSQQSCRQSRWRPIFGAAILPSLLIFGHVLRNFIMTGWLLYPAPLGRINVDWAMPSDYNGGSHGEPMQSVTGQYRVIKAWARLPGPNYYKAYTEGFSYWFPQWRRRVWKGIEPRWFYFGSILISLHLGHRVFLRRVRQRTAYDALLIALSAANMAYWFAMAPDMRFGRGFFWIWMGLGTAFFLEDFIRVPVRSFILASLLSLYSLRALSVNLIPRKQPLMGAIGKATSKPVKLLVIENGQIPPLKVYVPVAGDQCGDSLLPSTPYPSSTLMMRNPGVLRDGFRSQWSNAY